MEIRLRQLRNGKWYKLGRGKRKEATQDEVRLWQRAQKEKEIEFGMIRNGESGGSKEVWNKIIDLAKWITILTTISAFLTIYVNWLYINNYFQELGLPDLGYSFSENYAVPFYGSTYFSMSILFLSWSFACSFIVYRLSNKLFVSVDKASPNFTVYFYFFGIIFMIIGFSIVVVFKPSNQPWLPMLFRNSFLTALPFLGVLLWRNPPDYLIKYRYFGAGFMSISLLFLIFWGVFTMPAVAFGIQDARDVLSLQSPLPAVSILSNQSGLLFDNVDSKGYSGDSWLYEAKEISIAGNSKRIYSLQYVGQSDDYIYIFNAGSENRFFQIQKESVREIIFLPYEQ